MAAAAHNPLSRFINMCCERKRRRNSRSASLLSHASQFACSGLVRLNFVFGASLLAPCRCALLSSALSQLVLDLDETLVHTTDKAIPMYDHRVDIQTKKAHRVFYILKRPFLDLFLLTVRERGRGETSERSHETETTGSVRCVARE